MHGLSSSQSFYCLVISVICIFASLFIFLLSLEKNDSSTETAALAFFTLITQISEMCLPSLPESWAFDDRVSSRLPFPHPSTEPQQAKREQASERRTLMMRSVNNELIVSNYSTLALGRRHWEVGIMHLHILSYQGSAPLIHGLVLDRPLPGNHFSATKTSV